MNDLPVASQNRDPAFPQESESRQKLKYALRAGDGAEKEGTRKWYPFLCGTDDIPSVWYRTACDDICLRHMRNGYYIIFAQANISYSVSRISYRVSDISLNITRVQHHSPIFRNIFFVVQSQNISISFGCRLFFLRRRDSKGAAMNDLPVASQNRDPAFPQESESLLLRQIR